MSRNQRVFAWHAIEKRDVLLQACAGGLEENDKQLLVSRSAHILSVANVYGAGSVAYTTVERVQYVMIFLVQCLSDNRLIKGMATFLVKIPSSP